MLVFVTKKGKNGKEFVAVFWQFGSGKRYRLYLPPAIARRLSEGEYTVRYENEVE